MRTVVNQVDEWLRPQFMEEIDLLRTRHTVRLESIFAEAIKGWQASCEDMVETSETISPDGSKSSVRKVRGQSGNSGHLRVAMEALRDLRAIWGVDKPPIVPPKDQIRVAGKSPKEVRHELQRKLLEALGVEPSDKSNGDESPGTQPSRN